MPYKCWDEMFSGLIRLSPHLTWKQLCLLHDLELIAGRRAGRETHPVPPVEEVERWGTRQELAASLYKHSTIIWAEAKRKAQEQTLLELMSCECPDCRMAEEKKKNSALVSDRCTKCPDAKTCEFSEATEGFEDQTEYDSFQKQIEMFKGSIEKMPPELRDRFIEELRGETPPPGEQVWHAGLESKWIALVRNVAQRNKDAADHLETAQVLQGVLVATLGHIPGDDMVDLIHQEARKLDISVRFREMNKLYPEIETYVDIPIGP